MFFLLYRHKDIDEIKYKFHREITEITSSINSRVTLRKINHSGPWYIFWKELHVFLSQEDHLFFFEKQRNKIL